MDEIELRHEREAHWDEFCDSYRGPSRLRDDLERVVAAPVKSTHFNCWYHMGCPERSCDGCGRFVLRSY
jgi:hypothetical protein